MTDVMTRAQRSALMGRIRGVDTAPELAFRRALFARGFRYRVHVRSLPGRPDVVLRKHRAVVFVHGCFWHRHEGCRLAARPKTNRRFWGEKFRANVERDDARYRALRELGWRVLVVWECQLKSALRVERAADGASRWILSGSRFTQIPRRRTNPDKLSKQRDRIK